MTNIIEILKESLLKYHSYDSAIWIKAYFDELSGGFNVYHKAHNFSKRSAGYFRSKTGLMKCQIFTIWIKIKAR